MSNEVPAMPPKMAKAIIAIMADIERLAKEGEMDQNAGNTRFKSNAPATNKASYKYARVDDFMDLVRPLMAKHGLASFMNEEGVTYHERLIQASGRDGPYTKDDSLIEYKFSFMFWDDEGNPLPIKIYRTVFVRAAMGPQGAGAAAAFASKYADRINFKIATGDPTEDLDAVPAEHIPNVHKEAVMATIPQAVVHEIPPPAGPAPMAKQLPSTTTKAVIGGYFRDIQAAPDAATVENIIQNLEDLDAGGETVLKERALEVARVALDVHLVQTPKDKATVKQRLETIKDSVQSYNALSKVLDSKCQ